MTLSWRKGFKTFFGENTSLAVSPEKRPHLNSLFARIALATTSLVALTSRVSTHGYCERCRVGDSQRRPKVRQHTLTDGTPQAIPTDGLAKWLGNGGGGFTHVGPCEIYIDNTMVLHGDNCEDECPGGDVGSTDMPADYSSCNGDCTLTIYWLAFQNEQWQVYNNCVPLTGSGSSTATTSTVSSSTDDESTDW